MRTSVEAWTDTIFGLYVRGELAALSAGDVRRAIDWIAERPDALHEVERLDDAQRRRRLADLIAVGARRSRVPPKATPDSL